MKFFPLFVLFFGLSYIVNAQNSAVITAFAKNYEHANKAEYQKAINELKNVYDERSYEINLRLGALYYSAGLFSESKKYYEKSIQLMPMSVEAKLGYTWPLSAAGEKDKIKAQYEAVLKIDPQHSSANYYLGYIYYEAKSYKEAKTHFEKSLQSYPFDEYSLLMMGWVEYFLGNTDKAKDYFTQTLMRNPASVSASAGGGNLSSPVVQAFSKSYAFEGDKDYQQAISVLKAVYDEQSYAINLRLGWLHYNAGMNKESATYYQKSIQLKPKSVEARLGYVVPVSTLGEWDKVVTQYNEILKVDPNNSLVNYRLGSIYYGRKDYKTAEKYFEKVVNLYPFDGYSLLMFGWTKFFLGKASEAKVLFSKMLMYDPSNESAIEGLGSLK